MTLKLTRTVPGSSKHLLVMCICTFPVHDVNLILYDNCCLTKRSGVYLDRKMALVHILIGSCEEMIDSSEAVKHKNTITRRYKN